MEGLLHGVLPLGLEPHEKFSPKRRLDHAKSLCQHMCESFWGLAVGDGIVSGVIKFPVEFQDVVNSGHSSDVVFPSWDRRPLFGYFLKLASLPTNHAQLAPSPSPRPLRR